VRIWNDRHDCVGRYFLEEEKTKLIGGHLLFIGESDELYYKRKNDAGNFENICIDHQKIQNEATPTRLRPLFSISSE
jgi:hypothetical protein